MKYTVGVAEMAASATAGDQIVTHALGSCLGVIFYDPVVRAGGLAHLMLPLSRINPPKAVVWPCMFVDTGIPLLFEAVSRLGARRERIVVKVAGGAQALDRNGQFRIGQRNYAILRKLLWKNDLLIQSEDVGGANARTMTVDVATGQVTLKSNGRIKEL